MKKRLSRGFTLVEVMIVVAIIAILAAVAIPNFMGYRKTAHAKACMRNMHEINSALLVFQMNHGGAYTTDLSKLKSAGGTGVLRNEIACPAGGTYSISYDESKQDFIITCSEADEDNHKVDEPEK